jgi:hypothetical protein
MRNTIVIAVVGAGILCIAGCSLFDNCGPTAQFVASPTIGPAPLTVQFDASPSSDADGELVAYVWEFGAGSFATTKRFGVDPSHTFDQPGTYAVRLTVADDRGEQSTIEQTISVFDPSDEFAGLLEIVDWTLILDTATGKWCVRGIARNVSERILRYAGISTDFYDAHNLLLGRGIDLAYDLAAGATWEFMIPLLDLEDGIQPHHATPFVSGAEAYD